MPGTSLAGARHRFPSWMDEFRVSPEEGGGQDDWLFELPRIRQAVPEQDWRQHPMIPMQPPQTEQRMPTFDPFQMWDYGMGLFPWAYPNAPWLRPRGL